MIKISKTTYLQAFGCIVIVLALFRCAYPGITSKHTGNDTICILREPSDSLVGVSDSDIAEAGREEQIIEEHHIALADSLKPHPIYSVPSFKMAFPDSQEVQMAAATRFGVKPVKDRLDAEKRKSELVYVGANPYFFIDKLKSSTPYLVPRASILLQDIGRQFYDSLYIKGIPLHKIVITSVLRTQEDVQRLRSHNGNATENSCHMYGTTFDISYNRYKTVEAPDGPRRREVRNDTLKWVLAEVLRDVRSSGRAYVKYEVKQGCFHITVR